MEVTNQYIIRKSQCFRGSIPKQTKAYLLHRGGQNHIGLRMRVSDPPMNEVCKNCPVTRVQNVIKR